MLLHPRQPRHLLPGMSLLVESSPSPTFYRFGLCNQYNMEEGIECHFCGYKWYHMQVLLLVCLITESRGISSEHSDIERPVFGGTQGFLLQQDSCLKINQVCHELTQLHCSQKCKQTRVHIDIHTEPLSETVENSSQKDKRSCVIWLFIVFTSTFWLFVLIRRQ